MKQIWCTCIHMYIVHSLQGVPVLPSQGVPLPPPTIHPSGRLPPPPVSAREPFYRQPIPPPPGAPMYHGPPRPHGLGGPVLMRPPPENSPHQLPNTNPLDRTQVCEFLFMLTNYLLQLFSKRIHFVKLYYQCSEYCRRILPQYVLTICIQISIVNMPKEKLDCPVARHLFSVLQVFVLLRFEYVVTCN